MAYPWFRVYTEMLHDPKMRRLSPAQRWGWVGLLCLANEAEDRGVLRIAKGVPYEVQDLADVLSLDDDDVEELLSKAQRMGMLSIDDEGSILITNFLARQYDKPSDAPDQTRERQRRHRDRQATESVTAETCHADVTPNHAPYTDTDTDTDTDSEQIQKQTQTQKPSAAADDGLSAFVVESVRAYENAIGLVPSGVQAEEVRQTLEELHEHNLGDWWATAINIAVDNNKRSWSYVRGILENHLREGTAPTRKSGPIRAGPEPPPKRVIVYTDPATGERVEKEVIA